MKYLVFVVVRKLWRQKIKNPSSGSSQNLITSLVSFQQVIIKLINISVKTYNWNLCKTYKKKQSYQFFGFYIWRYNFWFLKSRNKIILILIAGFIFFKKKSPDSSSLSVWYFVRFWIKIVIRIYFWHYIVAHTTF